MAPGKSASTPSMSFPRVWAEGNYTSWTYIRSVLLLSNKYQVDSLRDRCIQELRVRFPGNINAWDRWYSRTPWNILGLEREADIYGQRAPTYRGCAQAATHIFGICTQKSGRTSLPSYRIGSALVISRRLSLKTSQKTLHPQNPVTQTKTQDPNLSSFRYRFA